MAFPPQIPSIPTGNVVESLAGFGPSPTGQNAQGGATNPPFLWEFVSQNASTVTLRSIPASIVSVPYTQDFQKPEYESLLAQNKVYPPANSGPTQGEANPTTATNNQTPAANGTELDNTLPLDPRLVFITESSGGGASAIWSYSSKDDITAPLVEGWIVKDSSAGQSPGNEKPFAVQDTAITFDDVYSRKDFDEVRGVPALMSNLNYINFIGSGGKEGLKNLIDRPNQPRWYDVTDANPASNANGQKISSSQELTVTGLINWSKDRPKTPYRYQDFVFLKWWKKIPLNYMITLRRFSRPINDSMGTAFDKEFEGKGKDSQLRSAVHAITFLGEDAGNKISSIMGNISAGLNWKDVKADVWEVSNDGGPATADSPLPGAAKLLGFLTGGPNAAKPSEGGSTPPDPYNNGPYANKILGPVTVVDKVKARERGVTFKHEINLVFEYSARSIGGINAKAAMLDILSNIMILTYNTAPFWGGMNRHMPQGGGGGLAPFLGGEAGRKAWLQGNPAGFFDAVATQFNGAMKSLSDAFNKLVDGGFEEGLKSLASGAMSNYMKMNTTGGRGFTQGLHSILTGEPIGEWHVTVGNPMNPMMMIGNLVCTNVKIDFNDELGPDDFPTELKATITLEHGRPRDKADIESMFNKGGGRLYSLPPKMKESDLFSSYQMTAVDAPTGSIAGAGTKNADGKGIPKKNYNPLLGDPNDINKIVTTFQRASKPSVAVAKVAIYNNGFATYSNKSNNSQSAGR